MAASTSVISVAMVEDDPRTRERLVHALARAPGLLSLAFAAATVGEMVDWLRDNSVDVLLVDLGLPDGHGTVLIRDLALRSNRPPILGMSGDAAGRGPALAAGADSFLLKPIAGLRAFQSVILRLITGRGEGLPEDEVYITAADPLALHDDLVHAAGLLQGNRDAQRDLYVAGFVEGIARGAQDTDLATAAHAARSGGQTELAPLERLLRQRLAMPISTLLAPKGDQPGTTAQSA